QKLKVSVFRVKSRAAGAGHVRRQLDRMERECRESLIAFPNLIALVHFQSMNGLARVGTRPPNIHGGDRRSIAQPDFLTERICTEASPATDDTIELTGTRRR